MQYDIRRYHRRRMLWPVDVWVPDRGWIASSCLTAEWLERSVEYADRFGDLTQPISRWQGGLAGAVSVGLAPLVDFPPGPRDKPDGVISILAEFTEQGLITPTHSFRTGQRVFCITDAGRAVAELEQGDG